MCFCLQVWVTTIVKEEEIVNFVQAKLMGRMGELGKSRENNVIKY